MSVKLFTDIADIRERKILAAGMDMFEICIGNEVILWPIEKADKCTKQNHQFYKTMYNARKLFDELELEYVK